MPCRGTWVEMGAKGNCDVNMVLTKCRGMTRRNLPESPIHLAPTSAHIFPFMEPVLEPRAVVNQEHKISTKAKIQGTIEFLEANGQSGRKRDVIEFFGDT